MKLEGYRTYIIAGVMILLVIARAQGWISTETYAEINGILIALGISTLRAGSKADAEAAAELTVAKLGECQGDK